MMAFVTSIPIPMPRFQCRGLQMAYLMSWFKTVDSKQKTQKAQKDEKLVFEKKL